MKMKPNIYQVNLEHIDTTLSKIWEDFDQSESTLCYADKSGEVTALTEENNTNFHNNKEEFILFFDVIIDSEAPIVTSEEIIQQEKNVQKR